MNAIEAYNIAEKAQENVLPEILACIKKSAGQGRHDFIYEIELVKDIKEKLTELGFKVEYLYGSTYISWWMPQAS